MNRVADNDFFPQKGKIGLVLSVCERMMIQVISIML